MKAALGILTAVAILSFLYFFFAALFALGQARAEKKPFSYSTSSLLPTMFFGGSYTDRGKEWLARFYRRWFFGFVSAIIMLITGSGYAYLRDGGTGPSPLKSPFLILLPAMLGATALMAFLVSATCLLISLGWSALRKLRNEPTSDVHRRWIVKSLQWTFGCLAVWVLSIVFTHLQRG